MIIPEYWAEARRQYRGAKKQVTVRRYGWSNESQSAAQAHADARAEEALQRAVHDEGVPRREQKVPYNGADGLPIREEVIERHAGYVITRNSYGALCLNTPNILFADIDIEQQDYLMQAFIVCLLIGGMVGFASGSIPYGFAIGVLLLLLYGSINFLVVERMRANGSLARRVLAHIERRALQFPGWALRLYRTPAGFRILVTHRVFDPEEADVSRFFRAMKVDPTYVIMCRNQKCFRARLTAKPWRIGMATRMRPRPGVWPINPERLAERMEWIEQYQTVAKDYAACEYISTIGGGEVHSLVEPVLEIHDRLCQVTSGRPIA